MRECKNRGTQDQPGRGSQRGGFLRFVFPRACAGPPEGIQGLKEAADSVQAPEHRPVLLGRESGVFLLGRVSKAPTASHTLPYPRHPQPCLLEKEMDGTSLAVQWLRPLTPITGCVDSISDRGTMILQATQCGKRKKQELPWQSSVTESMGSIPGWGAKTPRAS